MTNETSVKNDSRKRTRSPNYPAIGLAEAVERVRKLYVADGKAGATREAAIRRIGFNSENGQSVAVLSALSKFALVEDKNGRVVPSKLAIDIIAFPADHARHETALQECALRPTIYRQLVERFREAGTLPSEETLKPELIADSGFNPKAVSGFLADFRGSLECAGLLQGNSLRLTNVPSGIDEKEPDSADQPRVINPAATSSISRQPAKNPPQVLPLPILMDDGTLYIVNIPQMSERAFAFFKQQLEVYQEAFVKKPSTSTPDQED